LRLTPDIATEVEATSNPAHLEREDCTLVTWYRSLYAPRTGGAYDSHHRTAGVAGCTRRRGGGVAARGARAAAGDAGDRGPQRRVAEGYAPSCASEFSRNRNNAAAAKQRCERIPAEVRVRPDAGSPVRSSGQAAAAQVLCCGVPVSRTRQKTEPLPGTVCATAAVPTLGSVQITRVSAYPVFATETARRSGPPLCAMADAMSGPGTGTASRHFCSRRLHTARVRYGPQP